jgi:hypothetical protein
MLLTDTLVALTTSLGLVAGSLAAWTSLRASQQSLQALDQMHTQRREMDRLLTRLSLSAGALTIGFNANGQVHWVARTPGVEGTEAGGLRDDTLLLRHPRSLDSQDCQGNQVSTLDHISNRFKLSSKAELTCKDIERDGTLYQSLAERVEDLQVLYAEVLPAAGNNRLQDTLQWRNASQVLDWRHVQAIEVCLRWASPQRLLQGSTSTVGCQGENLARDGRWRQRWKQVYWLGSQAH